MIWKKYPKIRALGSPETEGIFDGNIVVQSKVDGANFSFFLDDGKLIFASRNKIMLDKKDPKSWIGMVPIMSSFERCPEKFNPNYIYVGESLQKHSIAYLDIPPFLGYDIWDIRTELFLDWKNSKSEFKSLGLNFINVHFEANGNRVTIEEIKECINKSPYREGGDEGIVVKNYEKQIFAKIVTDDFKEKSRAIFKGGNRPPEEGNTSIIVSNIYATDARIEKTIYKLVDEGNELNMSLVPILFTALAEDILEENIIEIYHLVNKIDFKYFNNILAKKCVPILKKTLLEGAKK